MAKWGKCDFKALTDLQDKMKQLQKDDFDLFCEQCAKELAARLLAKVIKRTPVGGAKIVDKNGKVVSTGKYADGSKGGTLRRGWTAKSQREAESSATFGGGSGAKTYADSLKVTKTGNVYQVEITNPVEYAPYVEFGHRTSNHKGWVNGVFMLTISEQELETQSAAILEKKLLKFLGGAVT